MFYVFKNNDIIEEDIFSTFKEARDCVVSSLNINDIEMIKHDWDGSPITDSNKNTLEIRKIIKLCDICYKNESVNCCDDPYGCEIGGDYSIVHFWCNDKECCEIKDSDLKSSAEDI